MAIYHMSVKTVGRSAGKSATAAAAYRACEKIECEREGLVHDYTRKGGLIHSEIITPKGSPMWATDRAALWNAAEARETRKNSTVAREFEIALPAELSKEERLALARSFVRELVEQHGFVADMNIHDAHDGNENHHAHILCTTRRMEEKGLTDKTRELDEKTTGTVDFWRERWGTLTNDALERAGHSQRVDHRSHKTLGIERPPQIHVGHGKSKGLRRERNETIKAVGRELGALRRELASLATEGLRQAHAIVDQAKDKGRSALEEFRAKQAAAKEQAKALEREKAKELERQRSAQKAKAPERKRDDSPGMGM